jgi:hypothetical protein
MDAELLKGAFAIVVAAVAFVGSLGGALVGARSSARSACQALFVTTITKERAEWRHDVRVVASELIALAHMALGDPTLPLADLHERRVGLRLRLNPGPAADHPLDAAILSALADLPDLLRPAGGLPDRQAVFANLGVLELKVQHLLKGEWTKSKAEAQTGRMAGR